MESLNKQNFVNCKISEETLKRKISQGWYNVLYFLAFPSDEDENNILLSKDLTSKLIFFNECVDRFSNAVKDYHNDYLKEAVIELLQKTQ